MTLPALPPAPTKQPTSAARASHITSYHCALTLLLRALCALRCSVVMGFSVKMATALSQAVIAGGAVGSALYALSRHHPLDRSQPLIDFDLCLMLTPLLLLGVSAGEPAWLHGAWLSLLCHLHWVPACLPTR